jgi:hypothetical protein
MISIYPPLQHRPYQLLDGSIVLSDDIVEVFDLTDLNPVSVSAVWFSSIAVLAPLLSIVTFSGPV